MTNFGNFSNTKCFGMKQILGKNSTVRNRCPKVLSKGLFVPNFMPGPGGVIKWHAVIGNQSNDFNLGTRSYMLCKFSSDVGPTHQSISSLLILLAAAAEAKLFSI